MARAAAPALRIGSYLVRTLELPPVSRSPNLGSAQACSTRTRDQSASSSSATIIGSEVRTPCPISDLLAQIVTSPLASTWRNALGAKSALGRPRGPVAFMAADNRTPRTSPAPAAGTILRNSRRLPLVTGLIGGHPSRRGAPPGECAGRGRSGGW